MLQITFFGAIVSDLPEIQKFTDFWLSGRGKSAGAPGATNDCFISPSQHKRYIEKYRTVLVREGPNLIAWAVVHPSGQLIHLLVAGTHRGQGVGSRLLNYLDPPRVRSKSNQQSGNPAEFYRRHGYHSVGTQEPSCRCGFSKRDTGKARTIEIFEKNSS